jgi:hypothetical protein
MASNDGGGELLKELVVRFKNSEREMEAASLGQTSLAQQPTGDYFPSTMIA